jgi:hypothetical protein
LELSKTAMKYQKLRLVGGVSTREAANVPAKIMTSSVELANMTGLDALT